MSSPMANFSPGGPSADAVWEARQVGAGEGRSLSLLIAPDSKNEDRIASGLLPLYHYLSKGPRLAHDRADQPIFSLTLLLSRQPMPDEDDLAPLIEQGVLSMTLTLNVPDRAIQELVEATQAEYHPLFAREAIFTLALKDVEGQALQTQGSGAGARAAFSANLGREETLEVLSALQGGESRLHVACAIVYRTAAAASRTLVLQGSWDRVYEYLLDRTGPPGTEFEQEVLRAAFDDMIYQGTLQARVEPDESYEESAEIDTSLFFLPFLRVAPIVLQRLTIDLEIEDPANRYTLRSYAPGGMELTLQQTFVDSSGGEAFLDLSSSLQEVFAGEFEGRDMNAFIRLVASGFDPIPRRVMATRSREIPESGTTPMAYWRDAVGSLSLALRPSAKAQPTAHHLLLSDTIHSASQVQPVHHWAVDDIVLGNVAEWLGHNQPSERHLPVIEDRKAALWPDRMDSNRFWYAPDFNPVMPERSASPQNSPFLFRFTTSGHDLSGQPGLNGTIQFRLKREMSEATRAAIKDRGNPQASPVALTSFSVSLELPFRDENGATRTQAFPTEVRQEGDLVTCTVRLIDGWVRLLYGALAYEGFQTLPTSLRVSYTYKAYVVIPSSRFEMLYGGKIALTPLAHTAEDLTILEGKPYLDARDQSYHLPIGVLRFSREMPRGEEESAEEGSQSPAAGEDATPREQEQPEGVLVAEGAMSTGMQSEAKPVLTVERKQAEAAQMVGGRGKRPFQPDRLEAATLLSNLPAAVYTPVVIRPELKIEPIPVDLLKKQYAEQTLGETHRHQVLYPCEDYGVLYIEETQQGEQSIGCQEAFRLGQTEYKQYRLLTDTELQSPMYTVYRSLQMPDRFLVVPRAYHISRFAPIEGDKAYRPAIFLYSTIDAESPENSRCVVMASLQPDLPPYVRRELEDKLSQLFHRPPLIEYITEIESQGIEYRWSLPSQGAHPINAQATKLWDSFQVALSTDVDGVPQLQAMLSNGAVSALVQFTLPDGTKLETNLHLDLRHITGPWEGGPLAVSFEGGNARMTNRIESAVDVSDLRIYAEGRAVQIVPVDRQLAKDESWSGPATAEAVEGYPVYTVQASGAVTLPEIRSFIEDIHTNVIFLNQVNYANHNLKRLDITARIKDLPGTHNVAIPGELRPASVDIVLPLTTFLANPVLQFQVTKTDLSDQASHTPWVDWPLSALGNVIGLTWELIEPSQP